MEERLVALLKSEGINPTRFAERIGVQRSSMSHILSGRNKPSFDFIIKILESFPNVNPDWLLRGKGQMYRDDMPGQPGLFDVLNRSEVNAEQPVKPPVEPEVHAISHVAAKEADPSDRSVPTSAVKHSKSVEKIVVFYSDKTFSEYKPDGL